MSTSLSDIISRSTTTILSDAPSIRNYAFYKYSLLHEVSFPKASEIFDNAFEDCSSLTNVSFSMVLYVGAYVFNSCSNLTTIYVGTGFALAVCILYDTSVFAGTNLTNIYVPSSLVDSY